MHRACPDGALSNLHGTAVSRTQIAIWVRLELLQAVSTAEKVICSAKMVTISGSRWIDFHPADRIGHGGSVQRILRGIVTAMCMVGHVASSHFRLSDGCLCTLTQCQSQTL